MADIAHALRTRNFRALIDGLKGKSTKESIWGLLTKGITFPLFYITDIFLARMLSVDDYGRWSFFFSTFAIILTISHFGINASAKTFIARYTKTDSLKAVLSASVLLRVGVTLVFVLLLGVLHVPIATMLQRPELSDLFLFAAPLLLFSGLLEFLKQVYNGFHRIKYNFIANVIEHGGKLIVLIVIFFVAEHSLVTILGSFISTVTISFLVSALFGYFLFFRSVKGAASPRGFLAPIMTYALPFIVISLGFIILTEIDTVMIGLMLSDSEVAVYAVAKKISSKLPQIAMGIAMGTMPVFAKITAENIGKLRKRFRNLLLLNGLVFALVCIGVLSTGWFIIPFFFGSEYSASVIPLYILLPYVVEVSFSVFLSSFLDYTKRANKRAVNLIATIIINIILNYLLIPRFGVMGAAIGTSLSYIPYFVLNSVEVFMTFRSFEKIESNNIN